MARHEFVPLTDQQALKRIHKWGHFANPNRTEDVKKKHVKDLSLLDDVSVDAIASLQEFMGVEYQRICWDEYARAGDADGIIGPATQRLLQVERCGVADYAMATDEAGRGSMPPGCDPERPGIHTWTNSVDKRRMPGYLQPVFEAAWDLMVASYADIGLLMTREDGNQNANTTATFENLGGSTIGMAIVGRNLQCRTSDWLKLSTSYRPQDLVNQWARLIAHEEGHRVGMSHFRGGTMNSSIVGGTYDKNEWRGDPAESQLVRYFGGVPINIGDEPEPPTPPDNVDSIARPGPEWVAYTGTNRRGGKVFQETGWSKET